MSLLLRFMARFLRFDIGFYIDYYPDLQLASRSQALRHWLVYGMRERRVRSWIGLCGRMEMSGISPARFGPATYLALNPDLPFRSPALAAWHYLNHGLEEGRLFEIDVAPMCALIRKATDADRRWIATEPTIDRPVPRWDLKSKELVVADRNEALLKEHAPDDIVLVAHQIGFGYPPSIRYFDQCCTGLDYGLQTRISLLLGLLIAGGLVVEEGGDVFGLATRPEVRRAPRMPSTADLAERRISLMGIDVTSHGDWYLRAYQGEHRGRARSPRTVPSSPSPVDRTHRLPRASVICSIYRSERFARRFVENIERQTVFAECEVVLVLVDPTSRELRLYTEFAARWKNVILEIVPSRIGIYDAWNRGVRRASAPYITNMNVDDERRHDSLERQISLLDSLDWADVVYQDVHVMLDSYLDWPLVEYIDARVPLSVSNLSVFLDYVNPPHNAPMWRAALHKEIGYFDESMRSAGDVDFWARCAAAGKAFYNTTDAHVAYYENPGGLSTSPETPGVVEHQRVISRLVHGFAGVEPPSDIEWGSNEVVWSRAERLTIDLIRRLAMMRDPVVGAV